MMTARVVIKDKLFCSQLKSCVITMGSEDESEHKNLKILYIIIGILVLVLFVLIVVLIIICGECHILNEL